MHANNGIVVVDTKRNGIAWISRITHRRLILANSYRCEGAAWAADGTAKKKTEYLEWFFTRVLSDVCTEDAGCSEGFVAIDTLVWPLPTVNLSTRHTVYDNYICQVYGQLLYISTFHGKIIL